MDELEQFYNSLNDSDLHWWPFLFLRPSPEHPMTTKRVALLAVLYGAFVGTLINMVLAILGRSVNPWIFPVAATVSLFVLYRFTFAYFWNRRARRLARSKNPCLRWRGNQHKDSESDNR